MAYIAILLSYLLGSIPTAYLITKSVKGLDIRRFGSGNVGATNVIRVAGMKAGIATMLLDILKGVLAVTIIPIFVHIANPELIHIACGLAVVLGHNWPVFLKFHGGKGVAAGTGVLIGLVPVVFLSVVCIWAVSFIISKYISFASICAAFFLPAFLILYNKPLNYQILGIIIAVLIVIQHRGNIKRLLNGKETKTRL